MMRARDRRITHQRDEDFYNGEFSLVEKLRQGLADAGLDCRCEDEAGRIFEKVDEIRRLGALEDARKMRDAIAIVMVLLTEIDELTADERDLSSFEEIACLFEDVAEYASRGASFSRLLTFSGRARHEGSVQ
ncbi:hypothetical protein [Oricola nitratireducens]|uniref:hypothetical protein n=1 Tax=Oricola nitratireducens TaxID=2775868 RepID=UPI001868A382|nr:hypothetical protein [Oricola nitratireducens]